MNHSCDELRRLIWADHLGQELLVGEARLQKLIHRAELLAFLDDFSDVLIHLSFFSEQVGQLIQLELIF